MLRLRALYSRALEWITNRGSPKSIPLEWGAPRLTTYPSEDLWRRLEVDDVENLKSIVIEIEKLSMVYKYFPTNIKDADWIDMTRMTTAKQRLDHVKHLKRCERLKEKEELKNAERKRAREEQLAKIETRRSEAPFLLIQNADVVNMEKQIAAQRYIHSVLVEKPPSIVVDCRFLPHLSLRGLNLTALQLKYLVSANKDRSEPWPLYFANFDPTATPQLARAKDKHLNFLDSRKLVTPECTTLNYTDLFPRERIVYLSPNAEEDLETVEDEDVFVIGGIVDRVAEHGIPKQASKETADKDGVRSARLPLDRFVEWKSGTRFLTLMAVMGILQDVHATKGDWAEALRRHIPVRNVRSAEEKNQNARMKHERMREFDRRVLEALKS